jgi:spermine oxidase
VSSERVQRKVIIVGAGLAGYSAAARLMENGIDDLIILEAENRIGGRIHSIPRIGGEGLIDMGAQWVHGQQRNVIYEMINGSFQFGDTGFESAGRYWHQSNGQLVDQSRCESLSNLCDEILNNSFEQMFASRDSIGRFFERKYLHALGTNKNFSDMPFSLANKIKNFYHWQTNNYFSSENWDEISTSLLAGLGYADGNQWLTWRDQGFVTVFDFITVGKM